MLRSYLCHIVDFFLRVPKQLLEETKRIACSYTVYTVYSSVFESYFWQLAVTNRYDRITIRKNNLPAAILLVVYDDPRAQLMQPDRVHFLPRELMAGLDRHHTPVTHL